MECDTHGAIFGGGCSKEGVPTEDLGVFFVSLCLQLERRWYDDFMVIYGNWHYIL